MCLFVSVTEDFCNNSLPVHPLFFSNGDGGGPCIFMVINTCTQSFNLPYLSHVTVWLHCLIWVSFNLSRPRLEINEGRKRHIWVTSSEGVGGGVRGGKRNGMNGRQTSFIWQCSLFLLFSPIPFLFPSLSIIRSLFSCLAARCSPFVPLHPPTPPPTTPPKQALSTWALWCAAPV